MFFTWEQKHREIKQKCNKYWWFVLCPRFIKNIVFGWRPTFSEPLPESYSSKPQVFSSGLKAVLEKWCTERAKYCRVTPHCHDAFSRDWIRLRFPNPVRKCHPQKTHHLPKRSRMNSSPTSFALIWNLDKNTIKGGHPWVIMGSLANHKGESLQAAAVTAKKRSTASGLRQDSDYGSLCLLSVAAQWAVSVFGTGVRSSAFIAMTRVWPRGRDAAEEAS